jgi:hypothetical protein
MRFITNVVFVAAAYSFAGCGDEKKDNKPENETEQTDDSSNDESKQLGETLIRGQLQQCVANTDDLSKKLAEQDALMKEQEKKIADMKVVVSQFKKDNQKLAEELIAREKDLLGEDVYNLREERKQRLGEHEAKLAQLNAQVAELTEEKKEVPQQLLKNVEIRKRAIANIQKQLADIKSDETAGQVEEDREVEEKLKSEFAQMREGAKKKITKEIADAASEAANKKAHQKEFSSIAKKAAKEARVVRVEENPAEIADRMTIPELNAEIARLQRMIDRVGRGKAGMLIAKKRAFEQALRIATH